MKIYQRVFIVYTTTTKFSEEEEEEKKGYMHQKVQVTFKLLFILCVLV